MADQEQAEAQEGQGPRDDDERSEAEKAEAAQERHEKAEQKIKELEDDPPSDLEDWPDDEAKYVTLGGTEGEKTYDEGPTKNLGPSDLRHHEDGSVTIGGEPVDNPEDYKGDPIPGGPTDPEAPELPGERKKRAKMERQYDEGEEAQAKADAGGDSGERGSRDEGSS